MAVEESIKIKIQANAEEFKIVSDIINKELGKLGKNFQILEGDINQAANSMKKFESSSKGFNKGLMNISLILQDLPYGFRGIQNNLPALAQGFGLLYLAVSAVTAAMTYFVLQGDNMSKGTKQLFDTFKDFVNGVVNDIVNKLYPAFKSITESIKYLWSVFGDNIIYQFKTIWENLLAFLKIAGNILAEAFSAITSLIKGDWSKFGESLLNIFKLAWNGIIQFLSFALKQVGNGIGAFVKIFNKDLGDNLLKSVDKTANEFSNKFKFAFKEVESAGKKIDVFALFGGKKKGGKGGKAEDPTIAVLEAKKQYYKDDILMFAAYEQEILRRQEDLEVKQATIDKKGKEYIQAIREKYQQLQLNSAKEASDKYLAQVEKVNKQEQKDLEAQQAITERIAKMTMDMRFDIANAMSKINEDFAKKDVKNLNTQLSTTLKATRGNYQAQRAAIEEAIAKNEEFKQSAIESGYATKVFEDNAENLKSALEGLVDPVEQFETQFNDVVNNLISGALVELGTQIGNVFSGGVFDMTGILQLLASSLIQLGTYLVTISKLFITIKALFASGGLLAPFAIPIGIAAIAAGAALKNSMSKNKPTAFANGGIVSGPTMGLIGEYPGAKNNPEVVAPLDKLKDLMSNQGGGSFVLRGQDLVLAMNRSESSLKLRRG
jgi:hypothetical protein